MNATAQFPSPRHHRLRLRSLVRVQAMRHLQPSRRRSQLVIGVDPGTVQYRFSGTTTLRGVREL